jgi:NAD+-dependent protein deacetylase sirtuin 4
MMEENKISFLSFAKTLKKRVFLLSALLLCLYTDMVSIHGRFSVSGLRMRTTSNNGLRLGNRPPDPQTLLTPLQLKECIDILEDWMSTKQSILAITGAGISTESGIPDYRGNRGSYHDGHKPMLHHQFMASAENRKRYWGRGLVGWRDFDQRLPNKGHFALATLEQRGKIGVMFQDSPDYHSPYGKFRTADTFRNGWQTLSIITQNVDALHHRAGSVDITELHGRTSRLKCMTCGAYENRQHFTVLLESLNRDWLDQILQEQNKENHKELRPDGDAFLRPNQDYNDLIIPPCSTCGEGFFKPDVVFFGDSVPKHRVARCKAAVDSSDGLLCIGSSLEVNSAFQHVKRAALKGTEICILNVGDTRAEVAGLPGITRISAPIGPTLSSLVERI